MRFSFRGQERPLLCHAALNGYQAVSYAKQKPSGRQFPVSRHSSSWRPRSWHVGEPTRACYMSAVVGTGEAGQGDLSLLRPQQHYLGLCTWRPHPQHLTPRRLSLQSDPFSTSSAGRPGPGAAPWASVTALPGQQEMCPWH